MPTRKKVSNLLSAVDPRSPTAFAIAVAAVAAATAIKASFNLVGATLPFAAFFPAVLLTALFAGTPAALVASALSGLVVAVLFMPHPLRATDAINFATFFVALGGVIWLAGLYRRALSELQASERARELLLGEMRHRAQNMRAVFEAIVHASLRSEPQLAAQTLDRMRAAARANDLVWSSEHVSLQQLVDLELAPYDGGARILAEGPAVELGHHCVRGLALVLHELATNAVKHGALKDDQGCLQVSWTAEGNTIRLTWREDCCASQIPPVRFGQGTRMMEAAIRSLRGSIEQDFTPSGLVCRLVFPPDGTAAAA